MMIEAERNAITNYMNERMLYVIPEPQSKRGGYIYELNNFLDYIFTKDVKINTISFDKDIRRISVKWTSKLNNAEYFQEWIYQDDNVDDPWK